MLTNYTAKYTKTESGSVGQLVEMPEVVTEGKILEECREMLKDALNEMILAYRQQNKEIPQGKAKGEPLRVRISGETIFREKQAIWNAC